MLEKNGIVVGNILMLEGMSILKEIICHAVYVVHTIFYLTGLSTLDTYFMWNILRGLLRTVVARDVIFTLM